MPLFNFISFFKTPHGAVVSTSDYESAGPTSILDKGSRHTAHSAAYPPKSVPMETCAKTLFVNNNAVSYTNILLHCGRSKEWFHNLAVSLGGYIATLFSSLGEDCFDVTRH